jgi:predicted ArsR family transcriptional regulator
MLLEGSAWLARVELLHSREEPLGVVEVAQRIGLHQNTVRSHLELLVGSGYGPAA